MNHPINDIILKFTEGDEGAFRQIFDRFYPELYYFSKRISGCQEEAEDISLCVFQHLFERRNSFKSEFQIRAFLFIAARNKCLNYLRNQKLSQKKYREYTLTASNTLHHYKHELTGDPVLHAVMTAIEHLPKECGKIIKMLYFEELEPNEVAATLQISVRTVYNQKSTGIKALRAAVALRNY